MNSYFRLIALLFLIGTTWSMAWAADWRPIPDSNDVFDGSRITKILPLVLRVWTRYTLNDAALEYVKKKGLTEEYRDYSYSVALRQIDCGKRTHGFVSIHNFNARGGPLGPSIAIKDADIEMNEAAPETEAEGLIAAVCAYSKVAVRKK
jgi:hypothetical protein